MKRAAQIALPLFLITASVRAENKVHASLISSTPTALPGATFEVAIRFTVPAGWHMYWLNPGDAGAAPKVQWSLPPGVSAGPLRFPKPEQIALPENMTAFGYEHDFALLTTMTVDSNFDAERPIDLSANVKWVVCNDSCLAEKQTVAAAVGIGLPREQNSGQFAAWRAEQPNRVETAADPDVVISVGTPPGHGILSISMPHDFETATEIKLIPPPLDFITFDASPGLHAIVGGMMVTQPFAIQPGQQADADSVAMLTYVDGQKKKQSLEIPFKFRSNKR